MKRRNGSGSYYQRRDGRWVAKVFDPVRGKHVSTYWATENEAEAGLRKMLRRLDDKKSPVDTTVSFKQYAEQWITGTGGRRRSESTLYEYRSRLRRYAYPVIGSKRLGQVTISDIERILDAGRARGLSQASVQGLRNALAAAFSDARKSRLIALSPVDGAELPHMDPSPGRPTPTTEEVKALLAKARALTGDDEAELGRILILLAYTGARIGELLGATWADVDMDRCTWKVARTTTKNLQGRLQVRNRTKTRQPRTLDLVGEATDALAKQRDFLAYRSASSRAWVDNGLVFPSRVGTVRDVRNLRNFLARAFPEWRYGFHGLRHWFASKSLATEGAGIVQVARLLGHRSTRTTSDVYGHLLEESARNVLNQIESTLSPDA